MNPDSILGISSLRCVVRPRVIEMWEKVEDAKNGVIGQLGWNEVISMMCVFRIPVFCRTSWRSETPQWYVKYLRPSRTFDCSVSAYVVHQNSRSQRFNSEFRYTGTLPTTVSCSLVTTFEIWVWSKMQAWSLVEYGIHRRDIKDDCGVHFHFDSYFPSTPSRVG